MRASQGLEKCNNLTSFKLPDTYCLGQNMQLSTTARKITIMIIIHVET